MVACHDLADMCLAADPCIQLAIAEDPLQSGPAANVIQANQRHHQRQPSTSVATFRPDPSVLAQFEERLVVPQTAAVRGHDYKR